MLAAIQQFLNRPGVQSSEFKVLVAVTAWLGVNTSTHTTSFLQSIVIAAPGAIYAIARGLAKYETRGGAAPPPTVPPAA